MEGKIGIIKKLGAKLGYDTVPHGDSICHVEILSSSAAMVYI
jgi:hypothetical protein